MMNFETLREGLEEALRILEEEWRSVVGDPNPHLACGLCFCMLDECKCDVSAPWPLPLVIYKLKAEIGSGD